MELKAPKILKKDAVYWAGGGQELATKLEIERGTVYDWGEYLPEGRAWQVEALRLRKENLRLKREIKRIDDYRVEMVY